MRLTFTLVVLLAALPVLAQDVPLPHPRPDGPSSAEPSATPPFPLSRPAPLATPSSEPPSSSEPPPVSSSEPPASSSEPPPPPIGPPEAVIYQVSCPAVMTGMAVATALPPIDDGQCHVQSPLSLEAVNANGRNVPLNAPVTTDCDIATALPGWIADVDSYLISHDNTRIATVIVGTNYACRNVDNAATGKLSFHAFADALDVVGFKLEDGRTITVEQGWTGTEEQGSRIIRFAHDAACTHFTTVLGPEANALHHDHLHVDLGCHGSRCVARLCE
jgi:hypothetical protein